MRLSFDSIDEVKEFVKGLKGTRGGKNDAEDAATEKLQTGNAPAPIMPPAGAVAGFNPQAGFAPTGAPAFNPGAAQTGPDPAVLALVQRVSARIDWSIAPPPNGAGQPADQVLTWFRSQLGPETANYTLDQIKQNALPRAAVPTLEGIAKLMGA